MFCGVVSLPRLVMMAVAMRGNDAVLVRWHLADITNMGSKRACRQGWGYIWAFNGATV